jgi:hypothetical protein
VLVLSVIARDVLTVAGTTDWRFAVVARGAGFGVMTLDGREVGFWAVTLEGRGFEAVAEIAFGLAGAGAAVCFGAGCATIRMILASLINRPCPAGQVK